MKSCSNELKELVKKVNLKGKLERDEEKGICMRFEGLRYKLLAVPEEWKINMLLTLKRSITAIVDSLACYLAKNILPKAGIDDSKALSPFCQELSKIFDHWIEMENTKRMKDKVRNLKVAVLSLLEYDTSYRWRFQYLFEKVLDGSIGVDIEKLKLSDDDKYFLAGKVDFAYGEKDPEGIKFRKMFLDDLKKLAKKGEK